jgi:cysteinyl-tRNA synthetase
VAPYKKDAADYVLWKPSTAEQPGWDSPWGHGRPGWHIECSAISEKFLAPLPFDIHGGGLDLIFPHHENEIAQSVCAHEGAETGADFARYWMHNGYVTVGGEKMSKSLGNFVTVRELLDEGLPGEAIRLALLSGHYRQPLDVTRESVRQARARLDRYYRAKERVLAAGATPATSRPWPRISTHPRPSVFSTAKRTTFSGRKALASPRPAHGSSAMPRFSACCGRSRSTGFAVPMPVAARTTPRSSALSRSVWPRARPETSPGRTKSARLWRVMVSFWRTAPAARSGGAPVSPS